MKFSSRRTCTPRCALPCPPAPPCRPCTQGGGTLCLPQRAVAACAHYNRGDRGHILCGPRSVAVRIGAKQLFRQRPSAGVTIYGNRFRRTLRVHSRCPPPSSSGSRNQPLPPPQGVVESHVLSLIEHKAVRHASGASRKRRVRNTLTTARAACLRSAACSTLHGALAGEPARQPPHPSPAPQHQP